VAGKKQEPSRVLIRTAPASKPAAASPSLEIFQTRLDAFLCGLLWVTLLQQGVGLGDPQRALPAPAMLGFWDSVIQ